METSLRDAFVQVVWFAVFTAAIWTWVVATLSEQARASIATRALDMASAILIGTAVSFVLWAIFDNTFGNWPAGLAGMTYFFWRSFQVDKRANKATR